MQFVTSFFTDHPSLTVALLWIGAALATAAILGGLAGDAFDVDPEDDDRDPNPDSQNYDAENHRQ